MIGNRINVVTFGVPYVCNDVGINYTLLMYFQRGTYFPCRTLLTTATRYLEGATSAGSIEVRYTSLIEGHNFNLLTFHKQHHT